MNTKNFGNLRLLSTLLLASLFLSYTSYSQSAQLNGDYFIQSTWGCPNSSFCDDFLNWKKVGNKGWATVDNQPRLWHVVPVAGKADHYKITPTNGCPTAQSGCELSWSQRGPKLFAEVEFNDPMEWKIVPEVNRPNHYVVSSTWGCPDNAWCGHELSWDKTPTGVVATVEPNDRVVWKISKINQGNLTLDYGTLESDNYKITNQNKRPTEDQVTSAESSDAFICDVETVDAFKSFNENFLFTHTHNSVFYPGALINATDYLKGNYKIIGGNKRKPLLMSTNLPVSRQEIMVDNPSSLTNVRNSIEKTIGAQERGRLTTDATFELVSVYSKEQLDIALQGGVKSSTIDVSGSFNFSKSETKNYIVGKYVQRYYTIDLDQIGNSASPSIYDYFTDNEWVNREIINKNIKPLIVSNVTYGRIAYFLLETTESELEAKATLNASYKSVISADVKSSIDFNNLMKKSTMKVFLIGDTDNKGHSVITDYESFISKINNSPTLPKDALAAPISYKFKFLNFDDAFIHATTQYKKRTCKPNSLDYRITVRNFYCGPCEGDQINEVKGTITLSSKINGTITKIKDISIQDNTGDYKKIISLNKITSNINAGQKFSAKRTDKVEFVIAANITEIDDGIFTGGDDHGSTSQTVSLGTNVSKDVRSISFNDDSGDKYHITCDIEVIDE